MKIFKSNQRRYHWQIGKKKRIYLIDEMQCFEEIPFGGGFDPIYELSKFPRPIVEIKQHDCSK